MRLTGQKASGRAEVGARFSFELRVACGVPLGSRGTLRERISLQSGRLPYSSDSQRALSDALRAVRLIWGRTMLNKRRRAFAASVLLLGVLSAGDLRAQKVQFVVTPLASSTWRCDYSIVNDSPFSLSELRVFFEPTTFAALSAVATPPGEWISSVRQPDPGIPADGSVTWLSRFFGPLPGETVVGFSVAFTFTGDGVPGSQEFVFIDPRLSEVVARGFTEPLPPAIPEPSQVALLCIGLMGFAAKRIPGWGARYQGTSRGVAPCRHAEHRLHRYCRPHPSSARPIDAKAERLIQDHARSPNPGHGHGAVTHRQWRLHDTVL